MPKYSIRHNKNGRRVATLGDGKIVLGIVLGAISVGLAFLVLELKRGSTGVLELTRGSTGQSGYLEITPIIISLLVAMTSTYFATKALLEQRKTREAGTDPVLVAHLGQREDARELVTFNISNVGAGAALNVVMDVEKPDDKIDGRNLIANIFKQHHPFAVILQGKSIEFNFALGWELLGDNPLPPFQAKLAYEDLAGGQYESKFMIDVREMEGLGTNKSPQMRIVAALEKIAKNQV